MVKYYRQWIEPERYLPRWLDPRLDSVRVADVRAYLLRRGWKPVPPDRPQTLVFQEPPDVTEGEKPLYQFVPDSEHYKDYRWRLVELITALACIEDRYAVEVLNDILQHTPPEQPPSPARPDGASSSVASGVTENEPA